MGFVDRVVQYPNRVDLVDTDGNHGYSVSGETLIINTGPYTLTRNEGTVTEAGTLLNALNLTENVDEIATSHFDSGKTAAVTVAAGAYADTTVTFATEFATAPAVVAGFFSTSEAGSFGKCTCSVHSITATGCTIRIFNGDSGTRIPNVEWIAYGA